MQRDDLSMGLLREFVEQGSETAFTQVVGNHLQLVYSAALRRCGDRNDLAEDICQTVFIDLARKARRIPATTVLAAWLYQHANFVASNKLREERRRKRRESAAVDTAHLMETPDWSTIAPVLDESLMELAPADRDPLVFRYLEQEPFAKVGTRLGLTENAARMRVDRALDKLRDRLGRRGIHSTAAALATVMSGPAVLASPVALTESVVRAALAASTVGSGWGLAALLTSSKLKSAVAALLVASVGSGLLLQHRSTLQLRAERDDLRAERIQLIEARDQAIRLAASRVATTPPEPSAEILRLRGEVARLRSSGVPSTPTAAALANSLPPDRPDRSAESLSVGGAYVPLEQWGNAGAGTPEASATTLLWALLSKNPELFRALREPLSQELNAYLNEKSPRMLDDAVLLERTASLLNGVTAARIQSLNPSTDHPSAIVVEIEFQHHDGHTSHLSPTLQLTGGNWRVMSPPPPTDEGRPPI